MLQRIRNVLQAIFQQLRKAIFQRLRPARFSSVEQITQQMVRERDTDIPYAISTMKKDLDEPATIPVKLVPVGERTTEPLRALMHPKNPAQRYRNLDILLEQVKRDRLNTMETQLIPEETYKSARHLQRILAQQVGQ
jgi:hypothetical protein